MERDPFQAGRLQRAPEGFIDKAGIRTVVAEATRILMGLGAAPTVVCAMTLAAQWFPANRFPLLAALTEMAGMTGAAVGQETRTAAVASSRRPW